jgi:pimeloyl-ACP methyl ester carboxylesterase
MAMTTQITSQILKLDGKDFEIYMCGDRSSDKLALFLHGFPEQAYSWRHQMTMMAELGYKCWAPNQRGYGMSYSPSDVASYDMGNLMADVRNFINAANCKTVMLIAHDWGGIVAWNYAIQKFGPIDKLVVMNIPHPFVMAREFKKWRQLKKSWYVFAFQVPFVWEYLLTRNKASFAIRVFFGDLAKRGKLNADDIEAYRRNLLRPGGLKAMLNWYQALFRFSSINGKKLFAHNKEILDAPTLMIWGERDVALGIHTTLGTKKYVKDFTIRYIPSGSHFVQNDVPDEVNRILKAWVLGEEIPGETKPTTL